MIGPMAKRTPTEDAAQERTAVSAPTLYDRFARKPWLLAGVLVVITFVAYIPALRAGFIWDDDTYFAENPLMASVDGLMKIWSSLRDSRFVPLTLTTFWVEGRLWGLAPSPYHAVNVGLHAINAVLLWAYLRRLKVRGAWVAAGAWAVHPVNVETVAWVSELKNTQSGLFFLLALLAFLRFEDGLRPRDYAMAMTCGAAAMLSKSATVVLPGAMLICAWWRRGRWTRKDFLRVMPLVAFGVGMSWLTIAEQGSEIAGLPAAEFALTPAQRLLVAGRAPWFCASKLLWPANLCLIYPRWELRAHSAGAWLPLAGLALVAAILWIFRRQSWARAAAFGIGYFLLALLPVLGFFNTFFFRYTFVSDHFQYLACIGLITLLASAATTICQWAGQRGRLPGVVGGTVALLILGASTWTRAQVYHNSETLWQDTLVKNPRCWAAHINLGQSLDRLGRIQEATGHFEQALRLKPDSTEAHYSLANMLIQLGRVQEAIGHYQQALQTRSDYTRAHYNLGNALMGQGRLQEAIGHYELALHLNPDYAPAHNNLGNALEQAGRVWEAKQHYELALQIDSQSAEAQNSLGSILLREGKVSEAIGHYEQALRAKPDNAVVHDNLGIALMRQGRRVEAIGQYEQALRLKPDFAEAHYNLGLALAQARRGQEAAGQFEQAVLLQPDYAAAHTQLAAALMGQGRLQEAIGHYEQVARLRPDDSAVHDNLGVALVQLGRVPEAIEQWEQALRINPDSAEAHYNLGLTLEKLGRTQEAIQHYGQALRIKPDLVEAQSALARLETRQ
jgi:tetratricopeptide (TPR) repeat protein